jgi:hypothetical protein
MWQRIILAFLLVLVLATTLPLGSAAGAPAGQDTSDQAAIQEAASWIGREIKPDSEYRYVMTCKIRLLLFWAGRDDVGGGYVRIGKAVGDDRQQVIQVLFGSDPVKAPLSINRWGAGTEVLRSADSGQPAASAFFGFMKSSKGQSVLAMKSELSKEKANGDHLFDGIISRVDDGRALTTTVPYSSNQDFDFHQYAVAEKATLQQLESNPARHIRRLDGAARSACPRAGEFLSTTRQLIDDAVAGRPTPDSLCYIYNARHYKDTLLSVHPVGEKKVHVTLRGNGGSIDRTYCHLQEAHFEVVNEETGAKTIFDILLGMEGNLRGAPIQITYEPNWWFQIILNLAPDSPQSNKPVATSRTSCEM